MLKKMNIKKRLTLSFILISSIISIVAVASCIAMIYISGQYAFALKNYGFSQGDIGNARLALSEARSATRQIISYADESIVQGGINTHLRQKESFNEYFKKIKNTLTAEKENIAYNEAEKILTKYWDLDNEIIELGNTNDSEKRSQAQARAASELASLYEEVNTSLNELMELNVNTGNELDEKLAIIRIVLIIVIALIIIFVFIFSVLLGEKISKGIADPLGALSKRLKTFAMGNLSDPFPKTDTEDEVADMAEETVNMANTLSLIIKDAGNFLEEMATGNFGTETKIPQQYVGEFSNIRDSMIAMNHKMNETLKRIEEASVQVSAGASNMAQASQNLAEGAMDQAGSVEELHATITDITNGVEKAAETAESSYVEAKRYAVEADKGREEMEVMVKAMERINETSQKIGNIISEIEDIASQTNLLSLNAAIEAARAGEAGKGFSVVAEQIGSLAEQSTKSAVNTRKLIESTIEEMEEGNQAATNAANSLQKMVDGIEKIAESSKNLSDIAKDQAQAMVQAEIGVNHISEVVQANSATAQETSATSEELSAQASMVSDLVGMFQLK